MQRLLPTVLVSVLLSGGISFVVVMTLQEGRAPEAPPGPSAPPEATVTSEDLAALRADLQDLSMTVATLEEHLAAGRRVSAVREAAAPEDSTSTDRPLLTLPSERAAFKEHVVEVMTQLEEEKEAESRRKEAEESNEEYDRFDEQLENRLADMRTELVLSGGQMNDLRSLLATQNARNREVTRRWSEGVSKEELDQFFADNRAGHRREVMAVLGQGQLGEYKRLVREGKLGGRFSFFVGPWENWATDDEGK